MSAGHDQAYLSDGISEEILNRLTKAGGLRVIARTSSFSFRDRPLDITEIGKRLGVSHVLEGSLRRAGDEIRITAQLISVSDNAHVWSETYTRTLDDLFVVQDEIAVAVADALRVRLAAGAPGTVTAVSPKAHESYLKGQYFFRRRAPGDVELARRYYEEAVAIDPGYARAWAALAGVYSFLAWPTDKPDEAFLKLEGEAARKAVALDPKLALAHIRMAAYYHEPGIPREPTSTCSRPRPWIRKTRWCWALSVTKRSRAATRTPLSTRSAARSCGIRCRQ